jgi:uncharacterized protein YajQ (UPF0234 family)
MEKYRPTIFLNDKNIDVRKVFSPAPFSCPLPPAPCPLPPSPPPFPHSPQNIMPSFDIVSEVNKVELKNAIEQTNKEVSNRFDFKGSDARVEQKELELTLYADDDFKLSQVKDVMLNKMAKRQVDVRLLDEKPKEKIGGDKVKQIINVKNGIETELGKKIQRLIKDSKLKVTAAIQGETVRITGAKRDDLQAVMALCKSKIDEVPLQFENFRD